MREAWQQIWQDLRGAVQGKEPAPAAPAETPTPSAPAVADHTPAAPSAPSAASLPEATADATTEADAAEAVDLAAPLPEAALPEAGATPAPVEPAPLPQRLNRWQTRGLIALVLALMLTWVWFAGGGRLWAQWIAQPPPAPDVIATFSGGQITLADMEAHFKLLVPEDMQTTARSPATLAQVVENLVMEELVRRWAATRQPEQEEGFRHTMQHISEDINLETLDLQRHEQDILIQESEIQAYYSANKTQFGEQTLDQARAAIRQTLVAQREPDYIAAYLQRLQENASITRNFELLDAPAPAEDDLRRYYEANLAEFKLPRTVVVDELRIPLAGDEAAARRQADDALLKVRSGASFGEVAQALPNTGVLTATQVAEGTRDPAWEAAVFALVEGELSNVLPAGDGFYVVRLKGRQPARTPTFAEVRTRILPVVQAQTAAAWFTANASKTLLTLKGKQYTLGEFHQEYQELAPDTQAQYAGAEGMKKLAERLIERMLLVEDAADQLLNVENKPLVDEARLQVLQQMLHQEEIDDKLEVTDQELQEYYAANQALLVQPPQSRIRYIRVGLGASEDEEKAARTRADEAYRKLVPGLFQQGADFATVALEYSEDPETAAQGGEFPDWIGESDDPLTEAQLHSFHEAVLSLPLNTVSPPFAFGDSLYIVEVIERTEAQPLTFEQAKPYIQDFLIHEKHDEEELKLQERLLSEANFVIYEQVLNDYFAQLPTPAPFNPVTAP